MFAKASRALSCDSRSARAFLFAILIEIGPSPVSRLSVVSLMSQADQEAQRQRQPEHSKHGTIHKTPGSRNAPSEAVDVTKPTVLWHRRIDHDRLMTTPENGAQP